MRFKNRPIRARRIRIEKDPPISIMKFMLCISIPKPRSAPRNSATTVPISDSVMAISRPAKMKGSAVGRRSIMKIWRCDAPNERIRSMESLFAEFRPVIVLIISGKNEISAAVTILEVMPRPNQSTISGTKATFGIDRNITI